MDDVTDVLVRHKLDVDDYYRMAEAGILTEDDRVELIDGELIDMMPIGPGHASAVNGLNYALVTAAGERAIVSVQNPVRLDRLNEPQPDFALVRLREDRYRDGHPAPADVLLLVEVADSSIRFDLTVKLRLYARHGIAEYWIVDLTSKVVDAYRDPGEGGYGRHDRFGPGDTVVLSQLPDATVPMDRVFGPATPGG